VKQGTGPGLADSQLFANGASRAIGRHQEIGFHGMGLAGVPAHDLRQHSLFVLREGEQLRAEADVPALAGAVQQDRLQIVLAAQAPVRGADPGDVHACGDVLDDPAALVPDEGVHLENAVVPGESEGGLPHALLESRGPEDLHGAHVVPAAAWVCRCVGMPLHEHVLDSETPQEHRGGKAHQGSAYDENWYRFHSASAHWFPRHPATAQPGNGGLARP
jgi:hypothetical protein